MDDKDAESSRNINESQIPEELQKEIQCVNGWIDSMDKSTLIRTLRKHNQNPHGSVDSLRKRLKSYFRRKKLECVDSQNIKTLYPYYVVLDFEATCNEINPPGYPHEIIEFPAVLVNTEKMAIIDHFQAYVKPTINPILSPFCITLTGISQEQVDSAQQFPEVLEQFESWLGKHKLGTKNKYAMVTDGPWDMGRFLYGQCILSDISYPSFGKKWINIRKCFSEFYQCQRLRLKLMIEKLGMEFVGHPHCGLDDATNIAHLLIRMIKDGAAIDINERIHLRYKLDPPASDENTSNQSDKSRWPSEAPSRKFSQATKDRDTMSELKTDVKQLNIQSSM